MKTEVVGEVNEVPAAADFAPAADLGPQLEQHRARLRKLVGFRMDPRLAPRVDPSDVVQESFMEAAQRVGEYVRKPSVPFFLWLRALTLQRLAKARRLHAGRQRRDVNREVRLDAPVGDTSAALVVKLADRNVTPRGQAEQAERNETLRAALDAMDPIDREVLALRHFEELSNIEAAEVLGIAPAAASKRHVRALARLRKTLEALGCDE
ncbi:MAG TPA: sigma-70 family RNA polymerase sigma factor [Planctomycetia bacterium]|jgi:RNA polymerase sigma-70 factor (ECF subfamily)|nr:sigma-70 family RNA polymerase sigma factor [Planctomycetia bacterium]